MAEELLLLGAILDHANRADEAKKDAESVNWVVPCTKCDAQMKRMKGHQAYNTSENSTILCDGCRAKVPATKNIFHCPKEMNLFHLNGFDYCLNCADKHRDKSQEVQRRPQHQQQQRPQYVGGGGYNNNNNNNDNMQLRQQIAEKQRSIDRMRNDINDLQRDNNRMKSDKSDLENRVRVLQRDKDELFREKRQLNQLLNDRMDLIDQQKDELRMLKTKVTSNESSKEQTTKGYKMDVERLQNDKLESQNKYRMIKNQLDDKLDLIEQYKDDIKRLKKEKEDIITNYNQLLQKQGSVGGNNEKETPGAGRRNEISPTLKAIFTQKFFADEESKQMAHTQYIAKIHTEILGMAFASFATIEWMKKKL